mmetsp:Transcript_70892/g.132616  ORF Transcript_70892/g.132616 Transcript_70892/m.132616 type:complete len:215 (-) Transcript_70892:713-1357(-)
MYTSENAASSASPFFCGPFGRKAAKEHHLGNLVASPGGGTGAGGLEGEPKASCSLKTKMSNGRLPAGSLRASRPLICAGSTDVNANRSTQKFNLDAAMCMKVCPALLRRMGFAEFGPYLPRRISSNNFAALALKSWMYRHRCSKESCLRLCTSAKSTPDFDSASGAKRCSSQCATSTFWNATAFQKMLCECWSRILPLVIVPSSTNCSKVAISP